MRYKLPPKAPPISVSDFKYIPHRFHHFNLVGHRACGPIYIKYLLGIGMVCLVSDPEGVEEVMKNKKAWPTRGRTGIDALIPNGLLALPTGPQWSLHRRLISPLFSEKFLQDYSVSIAKNIDVMLSKWGAAVESNKSVDVQADLVSLTFDIIAEIGFGMQVNSQKEGRESKIMDASTFLMTEALKRTSQPKFVWSCPPSRARKFNSSIKIFEGLVRRAVHENPTDGKDGLNMCKQMIMAREADRGFSERDVFEEAMTLIAAGHETTSNTLSWSLLLLSKNPSVLAELVKEVREKVEGAIPTYEEGRELVYTRAVIYETLRKFPTVPHFPRMTAMDAKLMGYDIPAGAYIFISQPAMNHSPKLWKDPDSFDPSRFLKSEDPKPSKPVGIPDGPEYGFIPFGAGPRTCVGQRLALLEAVMILASVVKRFSFTLTKEFTPEEEVCDITLGPKNGLWMKLEQTK